MDSLQQGRDYFEAGAWADACTQLLAVDGRAPLALDDLERLAVASYLRGHDDDSTAAWTRGYQAAREAEDGPRAARCAFWVAFVLLNRGDVPAANGWIVRAQRLLDQSDDEVVEQGYLRYLTALRTIFEGDDANARRGFDEAARVAERFNDVDLETLARLGAARALVRLGQVTEGVALLDEAMVAVTAGDVSPVVVGDSYCSAIEACHELFDLYRAQRWTEGLSHWCDNQPSLVAFRGQCLIHRAEILQLHGAWSDALVEAQNARRRLSRPAGQLALGAAHYQQGELHRLRGEFDAAEGAYEQARLRGREPQPGLAQLRLAQGQTAAAVAAIRRTLAETDDRLVRSRLLPASVEVLLTVGDAEAARRACRELEAISADHNSRMLDAVTAYARGTVDLDAGQPDVALLALRRALDLWQQLSVPYEAARVRVLIGQACRELGDDESARSEWSAAREVFGGLGAATDLAGVEAREPLATPRDTHGLTERELQVLRQLTTGWTNRAIAAELVISERTVDRHVSNILVKLGVTSRTAATAFAYRHGLV